MQRRQFVQLSLGTLAGLWAAGCGGDSSSALGGGSAGNPTNGGAVAARLQTSEDVLFESDLRNRLFQMNPYSGLIVAQDDSGKELFRSTATTHPYSLGVAEDQLIYVLDRGQGDVAVLDNQGVLQRRIGQANFNSAFQMAVGARELYLLSAVEQALLVLDLNGQLLRRLPLPDRTFFRDVAVGPGGEIHLLQGTPPVVLVWSPQGNLLRTYGPGPAIHGRSLGLDDQGRAFITDPVGEQIHLFDAAGNYVQAFSQLGGQPLQALVREDGTLFVLIQEVN